VHDVMHIAWTMLSQDVRLYVGLSACDGILL